MSSVYNNSTKQLLGKELEKGHNVLFQNSNFERNRYG